MTPDFFAYVKQQAPEWRLSIFERDVDSWEAVLSRNFDGRSDKGPHEVRTGEGNTPEAAVDSVLAKII